MKKLLSVLFAFVVIILLAPLSFAAEETQTVEYHEYYEGAECYGISLLSASEWEEDWTCYKDQLSGDALEIYTQFEDAFAKDTMSLETVYYSNGVAQCWLLRRDYTLNYTSGNFNSVLDEWYADIYVASTLACQAFSYDHPEYFWIRQSWSVGYRASGAHGKATATLTVGFGAQPSCDTYEERNALQEKIDQVVKELLAKTENMGVAAKLEYFDNWLAETNHYNSKAANTDNYIKTDDTPWSAIGALLDEDGKYSPVCEGYAKAFQLLCHKIGVPCLEVSGYAKGGGHMWTAVKLNGVWYLCDPTWDDPLYWGGGDGDESTKNYFLVAQPLSHTVSMPFVTPEISASDYDDRWGDVSLEEGDAAAVAGVQQVGEELQAGILFDVSMEAETITAILAIYLDGKMLELRCVEVTAHAGEVQTVDLGEALSDDYTFCLMITTTEWLPVCTAYRVVEHST